MGKYSRLIAVLLLANLPLVAIGKSTARHPKPRVHQPDPALLEFLGTWESPDGHWVDPMTFARINPAKLLPAGKLPAGVSGKPHSRPEIEAGNGA